MSQSRFSTVPSSAVCDQRLSHIQLRVLLAIGSFTSKDKAAYPKQRTIADLLGVSRETVNRAIKVLRELGYVSVEHQQRDDGGQRESLYWVNLDPRDASVTTPVIEADPCDDEITPPVIAYDHTPCDAIGSHLRTSHKNISPEAIASVERASAPPPAIPEQPKRASQPRGAARGSRIAPNWAPTPKDYAFASSEGLTREEINREADRFRDYWTAASGRNACKLDWEATWRNWLRSDFRKPGRRAVAPAAHAPGGAFDRVVSSLDEGAPRGDGPGRGNLSAFDAAAIDGEFTVVPSGAGARSGWLDSGSDQADAGSLFAKRRA